MRRERDRVVVEPLQVDGRGLVDVLPALGEVAPAGVHALHQVGDRAAGVGDDPADVREVPQHARVAQLGDRDGRVEGEAHDRSQHVLAEPVRGDGDHRVHEDAGLAAIGLLEEGAIGRVGELTPTDVRKEDHALHAELVEGALELAKRAVRIVHGDRGEPEEAAGMGPRELRVRVVHHPRDVALRLALDEIDVRRREREDLGVDADPIHVLQALRDVGHRRGHSEEPRASVADDPLSRRAGAEREVATAPLDALEILRGVVVRMKVEPHPPRR